MDKDLIKKVIHEHTLGKKTFCDMSLEERDVFLELIKNGVLYDERKSAKIEIEEDRSKLQIREKDERWYLDKERLYTRYGIKDI